MAIKGQFTPEEIVTIVRKGKTREHPLVGGRLRLAHEDNETLSIEASQVGGDATYAVLRATVTTTKGSFAGYGTASAERDQRFAYTLIELAETRSIARALRFAGYGVEYTGAEELSHHTPEDIGPESLGPPPKTSRPAPNPNTGTPDVKAFWEHFTAKCRALKLTAAETQWAKSRSLKSCKVADAENPGDQGLKALGAWADAYLPKIKQKYKEYTEATHA